MSDRVGAPPAVGSAEPLRWALIGTSDFAMDWVAPAIAHAPGHELVAVVSADPQRAESAADALGVQASGAALSEVLASGVDAVHVCTPNPTHAQLSADALAAGCHVLVEKPMAPTVADCSRMIAAARRADRLLGVGHCMNWAPPVVAARQAIHQGLIGKPVLASITLGFDSPPQGLWRQDLATEAGGGPLFDLGAHAVDALVTLFGAVRSVSGSLRRLRHDYAAEDTAVVLVEFVAGVTATLQVSFAAELNSLSVVGTDGELFSSEWLGRTFAGNLVRRSSGAGAGSFAADAPAGGEETTMVLPTVNVLAEQVAAFGAAVRAGSAPPVDGHRGLHTVGVLEAAVRSSRTGVRLAPVGVR